MSEICSADTVLPQALTAENACAKSSRPSARPFQAAFGLDEADDAVEPLALLQVGHDKGARAAHPLGIRLHLLQGGADMGCKIDLVDDLSLIHI